MTENMKLKALLLSMYKGNLVDAKLAYNWIMEEEEPAKGSDFDIDINIRRKRKFKNQK